MLLSDLIKSLVEIATDVGECDVYITTKNETQMYDNVLLHYFVLGEDNVLRMEGINEDDYEEMKEEIDGQADIL